MGPVATFCGLSKCMFRPSDDATSLPFHIPANAMMAVWNVVVSHFEGGVVVRCFPFSYITVLSPYKYKYKYKYMNIG